MTGRIHLDELIIKILGNSLDEQNELDDQIKRIIIIEVIKRPSAKGKQSPVVVLRNELAEVDSNVASIKRIADDIGLKKEHVDFNEAALNIWHSMLKEIVHAGLCNELRAVVLSEYPKNKKLRKAFDKFTCQPP